MEAESSLYCSSGTHDRLFSSFAGRLLFPAPANHNSVMKPRLLWFAFLVPCLAPAAGPSATTPPAIAGPAAPTAPPPPPDQDLDAGLKPQSNVPVIKVDETGATKTP